MKYTFRVIAVNKGGLSKPSEPSDPIVAKDRKGEIYDDKLHRLCTYMYYFFNTPVKFTMYLVPPKIDRSTLKDIVVKGGQNVKVDVKISGEPPPIKTWFQNKVRLENKNNVNIELEDYKTKLTIIPAARMHTGSFTIKAENDYGTDSATFQVTVIGKWSLKIFSIFLNNAAFVFTLKNPGVVYLFIY